MITFSAEEDDVTVQLYEKPVPETDFVKHCAQRRKYPVLLKVSNHFSDSLLLRFSTDNFSVKY